MESNPAPAFAPYIRDADMAVRSPWHVPERRLLDYLLVYIQEGDCRFQIDGQDYRLSPGEFCLIQPGQRVELRGLTHTVTPYAHFDVFFNPDRESSFATRPGQLDLTTYAHLMQPRLEHLVGTTIPTQFASPDEPTTNSWLHLVRGWRGGDTLTHLEAAQNLGLLILRLLKAASTAMDVPANPHALGWIPSYLSTHLAEPISVQDMAARASLSASRFQVVFKQAFGVSPGQYLLDLRVRHAGELLRDTPWTLAHIAGLCGFADVHHFAKTFKRLTGHTPGEHRQSG